MKQQLMRLPMSRGTLIASAWLIALLIAALTAPASWSAPVPDFSLTLLDGKSISLHDFRGKPVLVNFFHSK
jgi:cytochrome oxidase Cu insertion factor (SCO1/SenC/PrrC family)